MRNDHPSAIGAAWVSVITGNQAANDVVRPWLETVATTTDPRKKREAIAWCYGAAHFAMILANEGETPSPLPTADLVRSWVERTKEDYGPFTVLQVSRWCHGAGELARALWLENERDLFSKIEMELFDLVLGNRLMEAAKQGGEIHA